MSVTTCHLSPDLACSCPRMGQCRSSVCRLDHDRLPAIDASWVPLPRPDQRPGRSIFADTHA